MKFINYIIIFIICLILPFFVMIMANMIYYRFIKKMKPPKRIGEPYKVRSKIKRLLWDFPKQYVKDILTFNPNTFPYKGFWLVVGAMGKGKTLTTTWLLRELKKTYPMLKTKTNYFYKNQDLPLGHWKDLINTENGIYGEVDVIDEVHNWFNSMESKNFPPEMLSEIGFQRKNHKVIIGTTQIFNRVAKPIREQVYLLFYPTTIFNCLTFVRCYAPIINTNGEIEEKKLRKIFFFVHDADLRNSYDTYKKIDRLAKVGFKDESEQIRGGQNTSNNYFLVDNVKKGGKK